MGVSINKNGVLAGKVAVVTGASSRDRRSRCSALRDGRGESRRRADGRRGDHILEVDQQRREEDPRRRR
ncbi:MAG: hypothetical protein U5O39_04695 [Gammaproteobacteria bacterium]|nr:hypothetical protein [Gammaproteobacteria bacterium]